MRKSTIKIVILGLLFSPTWLFAYSEASEITIGASATAGATLRDEKSVKRKQKLLVTPKWLESKIKSEKNLAIIDLAFRKTNYETGHIPGAFYLDWRTDIIDSENSHLYRLPKKEKMEKLLSRLGITPETMVVLTDNMANRSAVRMFYTLKYFGHDRVRILDGGTNVWKDSDRKLTEEIPKAKPTKYEIKEAREEYIVRLEAVEKAIDKDPQLIDGRPNSQFTGEKPGKAFHTNAAHKRKGHVPSAANIPWKDNLNEDGTFKSIPELRDLYESNGISLDREIITYCNEGLHAAMPWFIIRELFGNTEVQLYDDSMVEWANRDDTQLKIEAGEKKTDVKN